MSGMWRPAYPSRQLRRHPLLRGVREYLTDQERANERDLFELSDHRADEFTTRPHRSMGSEALWSYAVNGDQGINWPTDAGRDRRVRAALPLPIYGDRPHQRGSIVGTANAMDCRAPNA